MSAPERDGDWQYHSARTPRANSWAREWSAKTSGGLGGTLDTTDFTQPPPPANKGEGDSVAPADTLLNIHSTLMILSSPEPSSDLTPPPKVYWSGNVSEAAWNARMMRPVSARTGATNSSTQAAKRQLSGEIPSLYAQTFKRSVSAASQEAAEGAHKLKVRSVVGNGEKGCL